MNENKSIAEIATERTWQQTIDRLVDGELSDADARELLAMLDGVEGGWRRLALAYVEAQWLRGELPAMALGGSTGTAGGTIEMTEKSTPAVERKPLRTARLALMSLAVAASMLVAFVVSLRHGGMVSPRQRGQDVPPPELSAPELAVPVASNNQGGAPRHLAMPENRQNAVAAGLNNVAPAVSDGPTAASEPRLIVIGGGADSWDQAVPQNVLEALRRTGHRVDQRSGVMPIRLQDGRSVNLPYDQVDVQYRGPASFQ